MFTNDHRAQVYFDLRRGGVKTKNYLPKFTIQYTGNEPRPYAVALYAVSVPEAGLCANGT